MAASGKQHLPRMRGQCFITRAFAKKSGDGLDCGYRDPEGSRISGDEGAAACLCSIPGLCQPHCSHRQGRKILPMQMAIQLTSQSPAVSTTRSKWRGWLISALTNICLCLHAGQCARTLFFLIPGETNGTRIVPTATLIIISGFLRMSTGKFCFLFCARRSRNQGLKGLKGPKGQGAPQSFPA